MEYVRERYITQKVSIAYIEGDHSYCFFLLLAGTNGGAPLCYRKEWQ
jgi:hypothetical protein